ncbi:MAG: hypothetical protein Q7S86_02510 [bacterium]|nr:hypothetical protein [bacterium]
MFNSLNLKNPHHAYAIEGGEEARDELFKTLENSWKITTRGNPDFSYQKFQTLTIDEARELKKLQEKKAFALGGKKIIVIEASAITDQAQNSLLKIFEEPTDDTHFFLLGHCVKNLIPTLTSRLSAISLGTDGGALDQTEALEFLKAPLPKRLTLIKKLADDIKDEKLTRTDALVLLQKIESVLYQKARNDEKLPGQLFEDLEMCRDYMSDRSASVKMLLEYVALVVPHSA